MCEPISTGAALLASAAVGAVGAYTQQQAAKKAADGQDVANRQAAASATATASAADQANNKANARTADTTGMSSANTLAAKAGASGTLLTGAQGVDPATLLLGKTTLLGA